MNLIKFALKTVRIIVCDVMERVHYARILKFYLFIVTHYKLNEAVFFKALTLNISQLVRAV